MSIELKQAAQQALLALENSQPHPSNPVIGLTNQDFIDHEDTIRQLRTAIQQAEARQPDNASCKSVQKRHQAQQPATGEPVAWMASYVDPIGNDHVYVTSHHDLAVENDMHGTPRPLYTHPAPSAPVTPEPVLDATLTRALQASTPAPWEASFHKTVTGKPFGIVTGGQPGNGRMDIVICHGPDAYDEPLSFKAFLANAPLIAAAPKLLAALELIANAENSALDLAYCKGVARAAMLAAN